MSDKGLLMRMYAALRGAFGPRHWWPADSPFEVMVGAVLTQNTSWANVEKAIDNLKREGLLDPASLSEVDAGRLQGIVRPAGYYRQKAGRLQRLARWVRERCDPASAGLDSLSALPLSQLREELLRLKGIGPETADSILLYAFEKAVFVVDAYTVRVLARHQLIEPYGSYEQVQTYFHDRLPLDVELFKDFHAQFVELGKRYCRPRSPRCAQCPVHPVLGDPVEADEWL